MRCVIGMIENRCCLQSNTLINSCIPYISVELISSTTGKKLNKKRKIPFCLNVKKLRLRASPLISVINDVRLIYCSRKLDYNVSSFFYMHIYSRVALTAAVLHQNCIRDEQICSEFGCLICFYLCGTTAYLFSILFFSKSSYRWIFGMSDDHER